MPRWASARLVVVAATVSSSGSSGRLSPIGGALGSRLYAARRAVPRLAWLRVGLEIVISGVHAIVFSQDAERARAFFRDTLGLSYVDAGDGWLIFALPPAELAAHPSDDEPRHELYLMCDDIHAAVTELKGKGVEFATEIADERWGLTTRFRLPGGGQMGLYQPRHRRPGTAWD